MGIKSFSQVFSNQGEIKYKDLKGKTLAIDAMYQLHRMAQPFKTTKSAILTAPDGTSTNHINGLIALILNLKKHGVNQAWVLDNAGENHNSLKEIEIERRKACRDSAKTKLNNILQMNNKLFSDSENENSDSENESSGNKNESSGNENKEDVAKAAIEKNKYERAGFSIDAYMVDDLKYILDCFNVPWIESPSGIEAESIAAYITKTPIDGIFADGVMSTDTDSLLFGARLMIKNDKGKIYKYNLEMLLFDAKIKLPDLIKVGVILGCDFAEKTARIGPKSVLKKFSNVKLSKTQQDAYDHFAKPIDKTTLETIKWNRSSNIPFSDEVKITNLYNWITLAKGFSKERTESRFNAAKIKICKEI